MSINPFQRKQSLLSHAFHNSFRSKSSTGSKMILKRMGTDENLAVPAFGRNIFNSDPMKYRNFDPAEDWLFEKEYVCQPGDPEINTNANLLRPPTPLISLMDRTYSDNSVHAKSKPLTNV